MSMPSRSILTLALIAAATACSPPQVETDQADYAQHAFPALCAAGTKSGAAGVTNRIDTRGGLRVSVRTPSNYDSTVAHPLLIVYAPGGHHRYQSEELAQLTTAATRRGFIIAYPDHVTLKLASFKLLGEVPETVASKWCIDPARIYATGHSDGGLASEAVLFLNTSTLPVAAIVASGAGIRGQDLSEYACPTPRPVMIIHSRNDELFPPPAYGREAANWWAACNRCEPGTASADAGGCINYHGCATGAPTRYCQTEGPHRSWHGLNAEALDFFAASPVPPAGNRP